MDTSQIKAYSATLMIPLEKTTRRKNPLEVRQLLLISRIMISILTIGLIGYTWDRVRLSLQKPFS